MAGIASLGLRGANQGFDALPRLTCLALSCPAQSATSIAACRNGFGAGQDF